MPNARPIRVMHVVRSMGVGGTEEGVRKLLLGLDPEMFEQTVCTVLASDPVEARTGARIVSLQRPADRGGILIRQFARVFREERPDIVHSRNWAAIEAVPAARLAGIKAVIHSEHGLDVDSMHGQPWRRRAFRRWCFHRAASVFAVCDSLRQHYLKQLGLRTGAISVIRNGVDAERFRPNPPAREETRQKLQLSAGTLALGTVSRLDAVKDHRTLFRAAEMLAIEGIPVSLIIIGDGPERPTLEGFVQKSRFLRERVNFLGEIQDVAPWLNAFDIFVLPSLAEGMSNTLLEAMASGVPPVASAVGGNTEIIEGGYSGIIFPPHDARALAGHLRRLAHDVQARTEMGRQARARIEARYSLRQMLDAYAGLYQNVAGWQPSGQIAAEHMQSKVTTLASPAERATAMGKAR